MSSNNKRDDEPVKDSFIGDFAGYQDPEKKHRLRRVRSLARGRGRLLIAPLAVLAVGSTFVPGSPTALSSLTEPEQAPKTTSNSAASISANAAPAAEAPTTVAAPVVPSGVSTASPARFSSATSALATNALYGEIPSPALAAYQRSASVIDQSAPTCKLNWTLLAAIGRVESDHGAAGLRDASNGVVGVRLNGKHDTHAVADTDGGALDGDTKWDRAVGPMQILPSTWRAIGVDADGDGKRDPQSIDDSSLAASVYLCATGMDLSTKEGRKQALWQYNHSHAYFRQVTEVMKAYKHGESAATAFSVIPVYVPPAGSEAETAAKTGAEAAPKPESVVGVPGKPKPQISKPKPASTPTNTPSPSQSTEPTGPSEAEVRAQKIKDARETCTKLGWTDNKKSDDEVMAQPAADDFSQCVQDVYNDKQPQKPAPTDPPSSDPSQPAESPTP